MEVRGTFSWHYSKWKNWEHLESIFKPFPYKEATKQSKKWKWKSLTTANYRRNRSIETRPRPLPRSIKFPWIAEYPGRKSGGSHKTKAYYTLLGRHSSISRRSISARYIPWAWGPTHRDAFYSQLRVYPVGSHVRLSNRSFLASLVIKKIVSEGLIGES